MKTFLKVIGVLFAVAFVGFGVWYWQALQISGDPLLTSCRAVDIYDDVTGEKIVGVEDMDFDPETGTIFMSAYDRRAVAREIEEGNVTTQGGIYTLNVSDITDDASFKVNDISRVFKKAGFEFRPHGIFLRSNKEPHELIAVNRTYEFDGAAVIFKAGFVFFQNENGLWTKDGEETVNGVCNPNDLARINSDMSTIVFSDIVESCEKGGLNTTGEIRVLKDGDPKTLFANLNFPNGIASGETYLAFAVTRDKQVVLYKDQDFQEPQMVTLTIAPDNLTVDSQDNLYVAGFPNLIDYYFYMQGWLGVKKSPSAVYRISPETYEQELLYKDDGSMISGATVALRTGDYLVMGSAWDDNIAVCKGMNGLD